jgi:hypothetical protein
MELFLPSEECVQAIRISNETPPMVSVLDVIGTVTKQPPKHCSTIFARLEHQYPEVSSICGNFKFNGRGQKETPVADAKSIVQIIMHLPSRQAAAYKVNIASTFARYLGGDVSLANEVLQNQRIQESLPPDHPARFFAQSVESISTLLHTFLHQ